MSDNNNSLSFKSENELPDDALDAPLVTAKGWTLGNSHNLVHGAEKEPLWISVGWIVGPTGVGILMLIAMVYLFGG